MDSYEHSGTSRQSREGCLYGQRKAGRAGGRSARDLAGHAARQRSVSPGRRKAATTANAALARYTSTDVASTRAFRLQRCMRARRSTRLKAWGRRTTCIRCRRRFSNATAYQCGYCTPGQIMSAVALLAEPCGASDADVAEFMSGNICRCGAYQNIVAAIQSVRQGEAA